MNNYYMEHEIHAGIIIIKIKNEICNNYLNKSVLDKDDFIHNMEHDLKIELLKEAVKYGNIMILSNPVFIDTTTPIKQDDYIYFPSYQQGYYLDIYNSIKQREISLLDITIKVCDEHI